MKVESQELDALCSNAKKIGWTVYLPEPVIVELKQGAKEKYLEQNLKLAGTVKDLNRFLIDFKYEVQSEDKFLAEYDKRLQDFILKNEIQICSFPTENPKLDDLFSLAVQKRSPFDRQGNNFRDVVIWYSCAELAKSNSEKKVYFVTRDERFKEAAKEHKPENLLPVAYQQAFDLTENTLDKAIRERYARLGEEIEQYIDKTDFIKDVERKIEGDIDFSLGEGHTEKLVSIDKFSITHLNGVDSFSEGMGTTSCRLSFIGIVEFDVEVPVYFRDAWKQALKSISEKPTKVGQKIKKEAIQVATAKTASATLGELLGDISSYKSSANALSGNIIESRKKYFVIDATVTIELKDDSVANLNLISVEMSEENAYQYIDFEGNARA